MLRLEGMEIAGFKSFRERIRVQFPEGITGVVGPNGCGKSNLLDAICWVLGEQSAHALRGQRMGDLIFNGTRQRRPAPMAEVVLRLAGTNGSTGDRLDLTRRLYQSGDSEYLLNGEKVRLKDITERLLGTGIGVRAYSIIHQGKVEEILASKPEERRILIEEAAGITRYRSKRRSAQLKLERTEQDLLRVADILREVSRQRNSLKRQASAARRFRRLKGRERLLLRLELGFRHRELAAAFEEAERVLAGSRDAQAEATRRTAQTESDLEALRVRLEEEERTLGEHREARHEREREIDRLQHRISTAGERSTELQQQVGDQERRAESLRSDLESLEAEIAGLQQSWEEAEANLASARNSVDETEAEFRLARQDCERLEQEGEEARESVFAATAAISDHRNAAEAASEAASRSRAVAERFRKEADATRLDEEKAGERVASLRFRVSAAEEELEAAREAEDRAGRTLRNRREELEEARGAREQALTRESREESRLALLRKLDEEGERCAGGVRTLLDAAREAGLPGFKGLVADHIEVEAGLEEAAEAALRERLQWVLVSGADAARSGGERVREGEAGGASFLYGIPEVEDASDPSAPEGARPLLELVRSDEASVARALRAWLRRAFLVDEEARAAELAVSDPDAVFVTRGGACWGPGPVLHQQGSGAEGGVLRLKREILEAETAWGEASHRRAGEEARCQRLEAEISRLAEEEKSHVRALREAERALFEAEAEAAAAIQTRDRFASQAQMQTAEAERAERDAREHEQAREAALARAEEAEERRRQESDRLEALRGDAATAGNHLQAVEEELRRLREVLADRRETREAARLRLEHARRRLEEGRASLERLVEETEGLRRRRGALGEEMEQAREALEVLLREGEAAAGTLREAEEAVSATRARLQELEAEIKVRRREQEAAVAAVSEAEVRLAGLRSDREHLRRECRTDLGETIEEIIAAGPPPLDDESVEQEATAVAREAAAARAAEAAAAREAREDGTEPPADREGEAAAPDPVSEASAPQHGAEAPAPRSGSEEPADPPIAHEPAPARSWDDPDLPAYGEIEEELGEVRRKLERIGSVNLVAIEEFEEQDRRFHFLQEQQADIESSIASLRGTIRDIDRTCRERFAEAFESVREYFQENFRILFKGGEADLRLQEAEDGDVLSAGIEIFAQPPGKRLQNIRLLSGGEKALSAIALLFGLFRYKPSPFCVLDEVDAPLDDANLTRFLELIEALEEEIQFILITHNRLSMERADILYGVTMQEPGCSKVVSVDFQGYPGNGGNGNGSGNGNGAPSDPTDQADPYQPATPTRN